MLLLLLLSERVLTQKTTDLASRLVCSMLFSYAIHFPSQDGGTPTKNILMQKCLSNRSEYFRRISRIEMLEVWGRY